MMDTSIAGRITWQPEPGSQEENENPGIFSISREPEGDDVLCMGSGHFDGSVGDRVTLFGQWVVDDASGIVSGFLFEWAVLADSN
jgi:hypothetical protein